MPYAVDFNTVSTVGLESSPVAAALAGLRAHEARYFKNKYDHVFTVEPASTAKTTIARVLHLSRTIADPDRVFIQLIDVVRASRKAVRAPSSAASSGSIDSIICVRNRPPCRAAKVESASVCGLA
jgi:hypothetical protein